MAATGLLADELNALAATITALGYRAVLDPREITPRCVFLQLPSFRAFNNNIVDGTIEVQIVAAPPGNIDAANYLLTAVNALHNSALPIVSGQPITLVVGQMELPAYSLTVRLATRRN